MEQIIINQTQLPDNIEDLTQFVLVGKAKLQAYMLKLQTVNKLSVAQEIRDQTLRETQEISNALIAAEQRIGELLLAIPKASGGVNQYNKEEKAEREEKSKRETISEMGYTRHEASDYQQMAKHPEVVQAVMDKALADGEVITKSAVMKEIKAYKDRITQLENQPPKKVEVFPDDYEELKTKLAREEWNSKRLSEDYQKARRELSEQNKTVEQLKAKIGVDKQIKNAERDIRYFTEATHDYIRRYGGHIWSFEQIQNVSEDTRTDFIKSIQTLDGFAQQLLKNVGGTING